MFFIKVSAQRHGGAVQINHDTASNTYRETVNKDGDGDGDGDEDEDKDRDRDEDKDEDDNNK